MSVNLEEHTPVSQLARRLTTADAVVVGLGAMLGAGIFAAFGPAARAAGPWLLVGLGIAAVVAFCNAAASAQLASVHPSSGGTYLFGRVVLGPWWGFTAGWGFVVGKIASCAAMAMTFAAYVAPDRPWLQRLLALAAVAVLTVANLRGVTRTARVGLVLLTLTVTVLLIALVIGWAEALRFGPAPMATEVTAYGILQSAGLLFFAFAGYARIATLAEEVRRPQVLGRAIMIALAAAVVLYVAVGAALVLVLGDGLGAATDPIAELVRTAGAHWAVPIVVVGAAAASLGALLNLLAGVGRTTLAMAREADLPRWLDSIDPRHRVPDRAQLVIGLVVGVLAVTVDLRGAIGFSSFGVLVYYAVTNLAALRQPRRERRWPCVLPLLGILGCLVVAGSLPGQSVAAGLLVFAVGLLGRLVVLRLRVSRQTRS